MHGAAFGQMVRAFIAETNDRYIDGFTAATFVRRFFIRVCVACPSIAPIRTDPIRRCVARGQHIRAPAHIGGDPSPPTLRTADVAARPRTDSFVHTPAGPLRPLANNARIRIDPDVVFHIAALQRMLPQRRGVRPRAGYG